MPEGDTIFRAARTLDRALAGDVVIRFESVFPALNRIAEDHPIVGRTIERVAARGKHLLMTLSGALVLRTHMRMNGSWHIYRPGERWQRPARDMRVLLGTARFVAVGFNVPVAEFIESRNLERHRALASLGPDPLDTSFDPGEALRRMRAQPRMTIDDALLDQRVLAGVGNVLKSEILFVSGVPPFAAIADLPDATLGRVIDAACDLLKANVLTHVQLLSRATGRRTTRSLDPSAKLWVYGRGGKSCRRCGARIEMRKTGIDARLTYWCPRCQQ
jgi:endonuclease VIII